MRILFQGAFFSSLPQPRKIKTPDRRVLRLCIKLSIVINIVLECFQIANERELVGYNHFFSGKCDNVACQRLTSYICNVLTCRPVSELTVPILYGEERVQRCKFSPVDQQYAFLFLPMYRQLFIAPVSLISQHLGKQLIAVHALQTTA